ncbi:dynein light chain 2, cytoplasmic [Filobasidium floriforme]|uniref:dynein light chain 2, cytoplasmic n=1 Tax=Filobasidium floriforme TaxID=5210 RepID=UPI001E8D62E3|nr:dynein light chain 2, cytoplasmic [Filobasidium floriforme]KAH8083688.1 dynein light chain 2, cytoplasmic [Filobasidium floriforme]
MDKFSNPADSKPSKTPLGVTGSSTPHKAVIKNVDMADNMKDRAIELATEGLNKYSMEKDMAEFLKREFDAQYGVTWHCVVGKNFGSFVTHETNNFIYFYLGPISILLWKTS